jgi:hypothetical protein
VQDLHEDVGVALRQAVFEEAASCSFRRLETAAEDCSTTGQIDRTPSSFGVAARIACSRCPLPPPMSAMERNPEKS